MILWKRERSKIISKINSIVIRETSAAVLLVIATDNNLKFGKHIENLCRQANFKLHAQSRIRKSLFTGKAWVLCNAFINR